MTTPAQASKPVEPQQPDALDAMALQLTSLQYSVLAMGGLVQAALLNVQQLLAARDADQPARSPQFVDRSALGSMPGSTTSGDPVRPPTFNTRPAAPAPAGDAVTLSQPEA